MAATRRVMSVAILANWGPMADERLNMSTRWGLYAQLFQCPLNLGHFFSCFKISLQEMAFAFQSPGHIDGIRTAFDCPKQVHHIDPSAARAPRRF